MRPANKESKSPSNPPTTPKPPECRTAKSWRERPEMAMPEQELTINDQTNNEITINQINIIIKSSNIQGLNQAIRQKALIQDITKHKNLNTPIDFYLLNETWMSNKNHLKAIIESHPHTRNKYKIISDHQFEVEEDYNGKGTAMIIKHQWLKHIQ